jgi:hypothetical protein
MAQTKFIFENGVKLTPAKLRKFIASYNETGVLNLPSNCIIKSIQGVPGRGKTPTTVIIIGSCY